MSTIETISEDIFQDTMSRSVQDVFRTMLGRNATLIHGTGAANSTGQPWKHPIEFNGQQVVGTVGFIGEISGLIYLYLSADFAKIVASGLLGISVEEIDAGGDEAVNDAVGELTNMTVGGFKNQLCDQGYPCRLTIPSILRGSNFSIEPVSGATRRTYSFDVSGHRLVTDLLMKTCE
jgi:chemotaxis protein CheX